MFVISAKTTPGIVKAKNQDSFDVLRIKTRSGEIAFAVLCDGMGGLSSGEIASSKVVKAFRSWAVNRIGSCIDEKGAIAGSVAAEWNAIVSDCHRSLSDYAAANGIRLGTTATVLMMSESSYCLMNIGDSRAYELTDGIEQLTKDHNFENEMIGSGEMTEEEIKNDNRRFMLTRCIGALENAEPEFFFGKTRKDAVYLLCSDGFRRRISSAEIVSEFQTCVSRDPVSITGIIEKLIDLNTMRGERDNITAVGIAFDRSEGAENA